jgi:hypothetical protein
MGHHKTSSSACVPVQAQHIKRKKEIWKIRLLRIVHDRWLFVLLWHPVVFSSRLIRPLCGVAEYPSLFCTRCSCVFMHAKPIPYQGSRSASLPEFIERSSPARTHAPNDIDHAFHRPKHHRRLLHLAIQIPTVATVAFRDRMNASCLSSCP